MVRASEQPGNRIPSRSAEYWLPASHFSSENSINNFLTMNLLLPNQHTFSPHSLAVRQHLFNKLSPYLTRCYLLHSSAELVQNIVHSIRTLGVALTAKRLVKHAHRAHRHQKSRKAQGITGFKTINLQNIVGNKALIEFVNNVAYIEPKLIVNTLFVA